jgi:prepilin-type processing-associated H-X9-DG protein
MIEMLTVVTMIGVLIMLLLPAVQATRESARMTQCRNNLLQLGLALGHYASTHTVLPPGVVNDSRPISSVPSGYHVGWAVQILPFIEQGNVFRRIDFRQGVYTGSNASVLGIQLKVFLCPSNGWGGPMNYAGCHHDIEAPIDVDNHGVLYLNSHITYEDITDGLAYTILLGEHKDRGWLGWASGERSSLRNTGHRINAPEPPGLSASLAAYSPDGVPPASGPEADMVQNGLPPMDYVGGFSSWHPGGGHFLFCDGSVRFTKETIDRHILQRLAHRSDGELVGDDQY